VLLKRIEIGTIWSGGSGGGGGGSVFENVRRCKQFYGGEE